MTSCNEFLYTDTSGEQTCASATECCSKYGGYAYLALGSCNASAPDLASGNFATTYEENSVYECAHDHPYLDVTDKKFKCVTRD